jgi:hypothetical protein
VSRSESCDECGDEVAEPWRLDMTYDDGMGPALRMFEMLCARCAWDVMVAGVVALTAGSATVDALHEPVEAAPGTRGRSTTARDGRGTRGH